MANQQWMSTDKNKTKRQRNFQNPFMWRLRKDFLCAVNKNHLDHVNLTVHNVWFWNPTFFSPSEVTVIYLHTHKIQTTFILWLHCKIDEGEFWAMICFFILTEHEWWWICCRGLQLTICKVCLKKTYIYIYKIDRYVLPVVTAMQAASPKLNKSLPHLQVL